MDRQIVICRIQFRLVIARLLDARLPVVRHHQPGAALKELECAHVRADPISQSARPGGSRIRIVAGAQHRHEYIGVAAFSGETVDYGNGLAGMIDEHLFSGAMVLAQDQIQPPRPFAVEFAEAAVMCCNT